jgi:nicotinamide phosphoribosyltransferase
MNPLMNTDSYKLSHKGFMNEGTTMIYSNLTARSDKYFENKYGDTKVVFFGLQKFIKDFLIGDFNKNFFTLPKEEAINQFKRITDGYLGRDSITMSHFEDLHDLGYLPIEIRAVAEGSKVNIKVPMLTIHNTHNDFAWLTNYLETVISCEMWKPITTATTMYNFRKLINDYATVTTGNLDGTEFQLHDFSFRGMSGRDDAATNGMAFLLNSNGTDSIPSIGYIEKYYNENIENTFLATSVPASEHSVACLGSSVDGEFESYKKWITEDYPTGIVSLVSDTYDYWRVLTDYLPRLKDSILSRPVNEIGLSKIVVRPDSGDPVRIICGYEDSEFTFNGIDYICNTTGERLTLEEVKGSIQILWEIFGGTTNELGFKELHSHIGLIYGDSITFERAKDILERLKKMGFSSKSVVFGIGSYTLNYVSRDTLGMAIKATAAVVDGKSLMLFKDPKTDNGVKKSAKGFIKVFKEGDEYVMVDQLETLPDAKEGELKVVFKDGVLTQDVTFTEIKKNIWG